MKKKLLIVANKADWQSWPNKVESLRSWFAPKVELEISLIHTNFQYIPFENYNNNERQKGVASWWYTQKIAPLGQGYDILLFVVPVKQWQGIEARGYRTNTQYGAVALQIGADEHEKWYSRLYGYITGVDGEAFHQYARHEIMHALFYIKCGENVRFDLPPTEGQCLDTTHFHYDREQLKEALTDLVPDAPEPVENPSEILIIHHTATPRDRTNLESILADHLKRYGRSFYQCFITADGKVHWQHKLTNTRKGARSVDYCVVGDFTLERPTEAQLEALNILVGYRKYLGHGEAVNYGASASQCPGTLLSDLEKHRASINSLAQQVQLLMAEIKKLLLRR